MAPGPVTAVTISKGNESPHAGGLVAVGHGVVEFPLMIALLWIRILVGVPLCHSGSRFPGRYGLVNYGGRYAAQRGPSRNG